jgi:phage shock protein PspC (stress-responsive transcriptional regulator)
MEDKKLYRSRDQKFIGGVCHGIGEYFDIEPIIIQALFFLLIWSPVPIILTYIFLWILMEKKPIT